MVLIIEQFNTLQLKSLKAMQAYALASLNGVEKLTELNLQAAKTSVEEGVSNSVALFHSRDPKALADTASAQAKPATDKLGAYAKHVYQIANETAAELSRIAEKQMSEASQQMFATIDEISKGAPAGTEGIATFYKSAVSAANSAWDQVSKANKQVVELTEANVDRAIGAAQQAAKRRTAA
jgi:phasin family protein